MSIDEFVRRFEGALDGVSPGSLTPETEFRSLAEWDSMGALNVIVMADADYGVELTAEDLRQSRTVADLFRAVTGKKKAE